MTRNLLLLTDSYKVTHAAQYPPDTRTVFSFFESRGGRWPETVFFGLQYLIHRYLTRPLGVGDLLEAESYFDAHFGAALTNRTGWERILRVHDGYLPVRIKAAPEGSVVPTGNVLMTVENTDPAVPWITNYIESLLVQVWYPCTVATQSREMKRLILRYLELSGTPESVDFKLHDFGFRGSTSVESSAIGGAAHLVNFKGTDTIPALVVARDIYGESMAGFSIPAAEHSTITSWGRDGEVDAYRNMLEQFPTGFIAVVSDSYDVFRACSDLWGGVLRDRVLQRDGCLVIRPDSGDPPSVLSGVLAALGEAFGVSVNPKGYKVLHDKVRVIQGDGIDHAMIASIYKRLVDEEKWSADNLAFGSGGGLLQNVNRDTSRYAFKCSWVDVGGIGRDVKKQPITDAGKTSKAGRLALVRADSGYATVREEDLSGRPNVLETVYEDGALTRWHTLAKIRERAALRSPTAVAT